MTDISGTPLASASGRSTDYGLWALTFSYVLSQFFRSYVAVISTQLIGDFHFTPQMFGWFSGAFFLVFAATQIPVGFMFDRYGVRYPTAVLMSVGTVSAGLVSVTTDPRLAIIAQAESDWVARQSSWDCLITFCVMARGRANVRSITTASAIGMSGGLLAAFPLSWGTANFGWRPVMALSAMLMLLATLGVVFFVRRRDEESSISAPQSQSQASPGKTRTPARTSGLWTLMPVCLAMSVGGTFRTSWGGPYLADVFGFDVIARGNAMTVTSIAGIGASFCIPFLVRAMVSQVVVSLLAGGRRCGGTRARGNAAAKPGLKRCRDLPAVVGRLHSSAGHVPGAGDHCAGQVGAWIGLAEQPRILGVALASGIFGLIAEETRRTGVSSADLYSRLFVVTAVPLAAGALAYWFSPGGARK